VIAALASARSPGGSFPYGAGARSGTSVAIGFLLRARAREGEDNMEYSAWLTTGAVVLVVLVMGLLLLFEGRKRARLAQSFGPEYYRAVQDVGPRRAERQLERRLRRVARYRVRPLVEGDKTRFAEAWRATQGDFVDDPGRAVIAADRLVTEVMRARGYPMADFETRAADLSVDHAPVVEAYRAARAIAERHARGDASTEELRRALVHYRELLRDLLDDEALAEKPLRALS
jgi:hypothetical protein